jgi:hypothetical protein
VSLSCNAGPAASNTLAVCMHLCKSHVAQLLLTRSKRVPPRALGFDFGRSRQSTNPCLTLAWSLPLLCACWSLLCGGD